MSRRTSALLVVIFLSLGLNVTAAWWGLPSRFAWAPDELQPPIILKGIDEKFSGDWHQPAYPPFHYYVLAASYLPVIGLDLVEVDSVSGRTWFYVLGRVISLAMGVGILILIYRLGEELFAPPAALFATIVAALSATFVYYAKFANLDVPAAFWVLWSLYFFVRHLKTERRRDRNLFAVMAVVAMCTKDQAYAFYIVPVGLYLVRHWRRSGPFFDRGLLTTAAIATFLFLVIHNAVFNFWGFIHHFEEILWARGHYSSFESGPSQQISLALQSLRHLRFSLGWPFTIAAAGGVWLSWRHRRDRPEALWVLAAGVSYYLFFIAPVRSTWLRYIVPLSLIFALFAGHCLAALWTGRHRWYRAGVAAVLLYSSLYAASVDVLLLDDSRYTVEQWLSERESDAVIGFIGPEYYLPRLDAFPARRLRPTSSVIERSRPSYLVINPEYAARFPPESREGEFFGSLAAGRAGYGLAFRHQSAPSPMLLDFDGILGNMAKINPVIEVYQRAD